MTGRLDEADREDAINTADAEATVVGDVERRVDELEFEADRETCAVMPNEGGIRIWKRLSRFSDLTFIDQV